MKSYRLYSPFAFAAVLALSVGVEAADTKAPANQLYLVTVVKVKPGMAKDWEAIQSDITNAYQKSGIASRSVWHTNVIGDVYEYATSSPIQSFADLDADSPLLKQVGKEGAAKISERLAAVTAEAHRFVVRSRPELSIGEMKSLPSTPVELVKLRVALGRTMDFENMVKTDYNPLAKKGGSEVAIWYQLAIGGRGPEYHILLPLNKFADLDKPNPIVKAAGKEAADKLSAKFAGILLSSETTVMKIIPELSYMMKPADKTTSGGE